MAPATVDTGDRVKALGTLGHAQPDILARWPLADEGFPILPIEAVNVPGSGV